MSAQMLWFLPAASHAFGKCMLPYAERLAMAKLLIRDAYGDGGRVRVDDLEAHLAQPGAPVYSIQVLEAMRARCPRDRFLLAVGPDNAVPEVWRKFREYQRIDHEFGKLIVEQRLPIRSTDIRARLASEADSPELRQWLSGQVGPAVAAYILAHDLYRSKGARTGE